MVLGALYRALGTKTKQVLLGFLWLCLGLCCVLLQLLSWGEQGAALCCSAQLWSTGSRHSGLVAPQRVGSSKTRN